MLKIFIEAYEVIMCFLKLLLREFYTFFPACMSFSIKFQIYETQQSQKNDDRDDSIKMGDHSFYFVHPQKKKENFLQCCIVIKTYVR